MHELFDEIDRLFYFGYDSFSPLPVADETVDGKEIRFTDYLNLYIERYEQVRSVITVQHYRTVWNKLRAFELRICRRLSFSDINIDFYNSFRVWIYDQGYSDNYFGSLIKIIKQVYREAREVDGIHMLNRTNHKGFVTVMKESDWFFF